MGAKTKKPRRPHKPRARGSITLYNNAKLIGGTAQILAKGQAIRPPESMVSSSSTSGEQSKD